MTPDGCDMGAIRVWKRCTKERSRAWTERGFDKVPKGLKVTRKVSPSVSKAEDVDVVRVNGE